MEVNTISTNTNNLGSKTDEGNTLDNTSSNNISHVTTLPTSKSQLSDHIGSKLVINPKSYLEDLLESVNVYIIIVSISISGSIITLIFFTKKYADLRKKIMFATKYHGKIWETDCYEAPFVFGIIRPRIYIPYNLNDQHRKYVLDHENTHIKHLDPLVRTLMLVAVAFHWWNPLVWVAMNIMIKDNEMLCDESVIKNQKERGYKTAYMKTLLNFTTQKKDLLPIISFGESNTEKRVHHLTKMKKTKIVTNFLLAGLISALIVGCTTLPKSSGITEAISDIGNTESITTPNSNIKADGVTYEYNIGDYEYNVVSEEECPLNTYFDESELFSELQKFYFDDFKCAIVKLKDSNREFTPAWIDKNTGISIFELDNDNLLISSGTKYKTIKSCSFRYMPNRGFLYEGERILLYDLTGDGVDELVIKYTLLEEGPYTYFYVFDVNTLKEIKVLNGIECLSDIKLKATTDNSITIAAEFNNTSTANATFNATNTSSIKALSYELSAEKKYFTIVDGAITLVQQVVFNNIDTTDEVYISSKLIYDKAQDKFVDNGDYKILTDFSSESHAIIHQDLYENAIAEYNEKNNLPIK